LAEKAKKLAIVYNISILVNSTALLLPVGGDKAEPIKTNGR